ncbi:energy-coupling factor transporter transmembrane component T family protein [Lentilactobacillus hilgardii]|uniref:Energy-coupling factor transporter transmembrane protein EcfT n=1 Tax=Lentilactobacillus hilgardii (strain ATCC 8290 / DSM 20176 / CCUG 30140 / JCM 1155 / KCTC 3500 / NBRC 15886 / NCIMB 8040 / NRRL B-1843 / 9) TaxID=1423757 RepID=C0XHL9_LENH9|nr:energy-coupling factor transporter transmembrane component T [Lentilactobacillus hilgardii]EEI19205.1 cobalt transport protein [Lentilactobacillus buchneri ATCC 11577]EEI25151.1 cobalt transport protein [Lentilactobacillus hilgardii DSM 20176 = ATCC 8290]KRK59353.1 ABC superfamily ATP binding cassette transporter, membrane protein [Lentilactobacillus hilgardii DSM 20176 = ATCC 8290]MCP9331922.1 energy-coupling factor transporter transmembrane protein EcfT [Lentilactobacillus hilgardii]MCP93
MSNFIFGRYLPGHSWIHQMSPQSKLLLSFYFVIIIFFANNLISYGILSILILIVILLSGISIMYFLKGIRPLIWLIIFTVLLQILFSSGGRVLWHFGPFSVTNESLINGGFIFMRFLLIIMISTVLTLTTTPLAIADGVQTILKPLKKVKFPVDTLALMLSIALRFVPTLMDEMETIMNAQRARGVDFGSGSLKHRVKAAVPLLVPLFTGAINHAENLSTAMEARGFSDSEHRTKYRQYRWQVKDTISWLFFLAIGAVVIFIRK